MGYLRAHVAVAEGPVAISASLLERQIRRQALGRAASRQKK